MGEKRTKFDNLYDWTREAIPDLLKEGQVSPYFFFDVLVIFESSFSMGEKSPLGRFLRTEKGKVG